MNVVLLQGPLGPFFADLADALSVGGAVVHRICFNKGDWHYAKADHVVSFTEPADNWAAWFADYIAEHKIDGVVCYGDSRFYHRGARGVCQKANISFYACEEGYIRPGYVTFEAQGNNANSPFPEAFRTDQLIEQKKPAPHVARDVFQHQFWFATMYYLVKDWKLYGYRQYRHHRSGNWASEMMAWLRAGFRKNLITRFQENGLTEKLVSQHKGKLFVLPLQVAVDTQMIYHSRFDSVNDVISEVMQSFAQNAEPDTHLVIKHHPMDRGFNHYGKHINSTAVSLGCEGRITYGFDLDLDILLKNAAGCVTVNSTVASQALDNGVPTLTLGKSMLETAGLTAGVTLDAFWQALPAVDGAAVSRFREALTAHTQVAGSFYCDRYVAADEIALRIYQDIDKRL